MTDRKPLTRRQIEALEATYHGRIIYRQRNMGTKPDGSIQWGWQSGNASVRMVHTLDDRGYISRRSAGKIELTVAGYYALSQDKRAMAHINPREIAERSRKAAARERDAEKERIAEREERERARAAADAQSRKDRLAKLWPLLDANHLEPLQGLSDDALLAFAARVHEIMEVY